MQKMWNIYSVTCQQNRIHFTTGGTNTRLGKSTKQTPEQWQTWRTKGKINKTKRQSKIQPWARKFSPEVNVKHFQTSFKKQAMQCKMTQIPANSNDGTTGHKLQGMSKDAIIVMSWPTGGLAKLFKKWEYVVLSCVRTLSGLYLVDPIDMEKSFNPSSQLRSYIDKIKQKEKDLLDQRQKAMSLISWT